MADACQLSKWFQGQWFDCMFNPVTSTTTEAGFGVMVGGALLLSLYYAGGGRVATPSVVLIIIAGILIPILPGAYVGVAQGLAIVGVFAGILAVAQRYVLNPSTMAGR